MKTYNDSQARERALELSRSFIVEAPAGSGKTELLIQRYLALLTTVDHPEEMIAITFTRKAAGEIRNRVVEALRNSFYTKPQESHRAQTWMLAKKVVERSERLEWMLIENPNQMRIMTLDALAMQLVIQMPVLSGLGPNVHLVEDPSTIYQKVVQDFLMTVEEPVPWQEALQKVLLHLNNHWEQAIRLLTQLLAKRDQWLPHLLNVLQDDLHQVIEYYHQKANKLLTPEEKKATGESFKKIASFLLTEKGTWRKKIPKTIKNLTSKTELREVLYSIHLLPEGSYSVPQWEILEALMQLLPALIASLKVHFNETSTVDFIEVAEAALRALGESEAPSDLALKLDYRISHLLVDEFQDTSYSQIRFLEKLVAGWEINDGRTLFLVGDPMQSIYRFRQAEVGLFLQIQASETFFHLPVESLQLHTNYRASEALIAWTNTSFKTIFPAEKNIVLGGVSYEAFCVPQIRSARRAGGVSFCSETQTLNLVKTIRTTYPEETIAILVRARSHLECIIPMLSAAHVPYMAIEIAGAFNQPVIQDLLTLLRALLSTQDKIAWLSLLRAPWCGLCLSDLCVISASVSTTIWTNLQNAEILEQLSDEGRMRVTRILPILRQAFSYHYRMSLTDWLKKIWIALEGPACVQEKQSLDAAKYFFEFLEQESGSAHFIEWPRFTEKLSKRFVSTCKDMQNPIQLMTIHRAKGLEFDHVILPGLEKRNAVDEKQLLLWTEHPTNNGTALLMSPIHSASELQDPLYDFLRYQNQQKAIFEKARLLYVAVTRAKQNLYLLTSLAQNQCDKPPAGSFLELLAPQLTHTKWIPETTQDSLTALLFEKREPRGIYRLSQTQKVEASTTANKARLLAPHMILEENTKPAIGTLLHRILRLLAEIPEAKWHQTDWTLYRTSWKHALLRLGVSYFKIDTCLAQIYQVLNLILNCPRATWILSPHVEAFSEYPLSGILEGEVIHGVIDRTFLDRTGTRWIVDYKLTHPGNEPKMTYEPQLSRYAALLRLTTSQPIRLGLYFPFVQGWCEWSWAFKAVESTLEA